MALRKPLKRYKFTYTTRFNEDTNYTKILYASSLPASWSKFNIYCEDANIELEDASVELL